MLELQKAIRIGLGVFRSRTDFKMGNRMRVNFGKIGDMQKPLWKTSSSSFLLICNLLKTLSRYYFSLVVIKGVEANVLE